MRPIVPVNGGQCNRDRMMGSADRRAGGVWGIGSHWLVSVEYKTLVAIEWRESQT